MPLFKINFVFLAIGLIVLTFETAHSANKAVKIAIREGKAEVTLLVGSAFIIDKDTAKIRSIKVGDFLSRGNRIKTDKKSRIELKLPDKSYLRFDEQTTFELTSVAFDRKIKQRDINVSMIIGKTWAKVSKFFGLKGRFSVSTRTAVAGVRGTVYRINVDSDDSVIIKVYRGEIVVNGPVGADSVLQPEKVQEPSTVRGPYPVAGPHKVTIKEWSYIVKAMQQITVRSDGTATKPAPFSAKADLDEWVIWNKKLDQKISANVNNGLNP